MISKEVLEDLLQIKYAIIDEDITDEVDLNMRLDNIAKKHDKQIPAYFVGSLKELLENA